MKTGVFYFILMSLLGGFTANAQVKPVASFQSPDGRTRVELAVRDQRDLVYRLSLQGTPVINWSVLGMAWSDQDNRKVIAATSGRISAVNTSFAWPLGESATIENRYHAGELICKTGNRSFKLLVRVYNGSFAFRYRYILPTSPVRLLKELTEFNISSDSRIFQYHEESTFQHLQVDSLKGICDQPATLDTKSGLYLTIGEADNRDFTKCVFVRGTVKNGLRYQFYTDTVRGNGQVKIDSTLTFRDSLLTPWRTVSVSKNAVGLHAFSQLYLKLVPPSGTHADGVKPGKVFRVPIHTEGAVTGIDFAAKMNFQYIMLDAGWYGAEFRTSSNPLVPIPEVDMPRIIQHANEKNIGVILYVNYVGLKVKLDSILPVYKKWGVSGLKFGFVDGGTKEGLSWLDQAVKKVNDYGFVLNIHDHYKPTGTSRRYPYLLSQEGIRGDENSPDAYHTMVLPFTRFLAGPADFTFCFPNSKTDFAKNLKVSKGQQLALTVIYFDPLQAIFWYGKSADYTNFDELEFFKQVPTVWDESLYLKGEIGSYISVARKKNNVWYIGSATGFAPWKTTLKLDFLTRGQKYEATIYSDDQAKGIKRKVIPVTGQSILAVELAAKEGQAVIIRPVENNQ